MKLLARPLLGLAVAGLLAPGLASADPAVRPHGTYKPIAAPRTPSSVSTIREGTPPKRIIYMDRYGGTFTPSNTTDDSSRNISGVPNQVSTVPPFPGTDDDWNKLMACVQDEYQRFNVDVVDVRPPDGTPYVMSVVGGTADDIQQPSGVLGVADMDQFTCGVIEQDIAFTLAGDPYYRTPTGLNIDELCETIAQETAHAYGLDHEFLCTDPMTYLDRCGQHKVFQDTFAPCGEWSSRQCLCTGATQNSVRELLLKLGTSDAVPPTSSITAPADGATVPMGFEVDVDAMDDIKITKVDLYIDDKLSAEDTVAPYTFKTKPSIGAGAHKIEERAYDRGANVAAQTINVTVTPDCTKDTDCTTPDTTCAAGGYCATQIGGSCSVHDDCASQLCAVDDSKNAVPGTKVCTQYCDETDKSSCPMGFVCSVTTAGSLAKCHAETGGGGGCAVGGHSAGAFAGVTLLGVLGLAFRPRRRRA